MRKALGFMVIACLAMIFSAGTAGATDTSRPAQADEEVLASSKCSGTAGYGVIRYQVCVRYTCNASACAHQGYLGVINTASSARTVRWNLDWSRIGAPWRDDDSGSVALAAGQQQTIDSDTIVRTEPCGFTGQRLLTVGYGSGTSAPIQVEQFMACA
ncbi:hypothetical protein LWC34_46010 [Kibdelosporangium philippinense]|uniref:Secreted protein n=1 Tax=Kibdelosporangium philippinense TaxID=211113 RepID=A0ABS8ZQT5_9PSEU|nr:hypothetical protein [Kibdelosporangium philippinense]MCE7010111.1 hypothetical protein [Kibdelosporangium philippinense]